MRHGPNVFSWTARGIASLRYDKRGVGQSSGNFLSTGLYDNIADAGAAFGALDSRPEIDIKKLFVLGHSEGALIATALATASSPLTGIVLLAGPARAGAEVLRWQWAQILSSLSAAMRFLLRILRVDVAAKAAKAAKTHERLRCSLTDVVCMGLGFVMVVKLTFAASSPSGGYESVGGRGALR